MKLLLTSLLLLPICLLAQTEPVSEFQSEFSATWERAKAYTLEVAEAMPEEHYHFNPVEEVMTFGEQLVHVAGNLYGLNSRFVRVSENPYVYPEKGEEFTKAETIERLKAAFAYATESLETLTDEQWKENAEKFWAGPTSRKIVFLLMRDHMTHHRGIAISYLRIKGIKPPGFRGW